VNGLHGSDAERAAWPRRHADWWPACLTACSACRCASGRLVRPGEWTCC